MGAKEKASRTGSFAMKKFCKIYDEMYSAI
jgi:hypothetical protein